ncbi:hypothetical protein NDA13_003000 [Ustilago tritici]|nr:hypothetical protein NDA13_003000 [Ustilago tritici]
MPAPAPPPTAAPSTTTPQPTRKSKPSSTDRQLQRRWIQLIDAWHSSSVQQQSFGTTSRDELVEEISQHAQTLCRTIKNRQWLLNAFRFAIQAVLFPETPDSEGDVEEMSRVEQLGQQLLQLAIHSIATPLLQFSKEQNAQGLPKKMMQEALENFERLSKRLSMFERLRGLTGMMGLPTLPLRLVLEEEASTVLLCLASLPQGAELVGPLLGSLPWLVEESEGSRLAILGQLLTAGASGGYDSLVGSGLLIGWKNGKEASAWSSVKGCKPLPLSELSELYRGVFMTMRDQAKLDTDRDALLDVLAKGWKGADAEQSISELRTAAATTNQYDGQAIKTTTTSSQRFDLDSVQSLASQISTAGSNREAQKQLAKQILSTANDADSIGNRLVQVIDTNDSANVRAFALTTISEAAQSGSTGQLASLVAAVLYARPAVGAFKLDLNIPAALLKQAKEVLGQVGNTKTNDANSQLQLALRGALDVNEKCIVPACQLLSLLRSNPSASLLGQMDMHLSRLRSISALVGGLHTKPELDMCWLAAYAGASGAEVEPKQRSKLSELVEKFNSAHTPPSSLGGRPGEGAAVDRDLLKFRASWDAFFHQLLDLCSPSSAFALIPQHDATHLLLSTILRTGDVTLFSTLSTSSTPTLPAEEVEELVLEISTQLFDRANAASTRTKDIRLSLEVLSALSSTSTRAKSQREFIEAACRLSGFKVKSIAHPGESITPKEIRETKDKVELVARLLGSQGDAHRSPELVLDLAHRLSSLDPPSNTSSGKSDKSLIEARVLAMLSDAATASEDFDQSSTLCLRLIQSATKSRCNPAVVELTWKSCFQLSKHPGWEDTPQRLTMLGHALSLAPPEQLGGMLRMWRDLDSQLTREVEGGKEFGSTRKATAGLATGAGSSGTRSMGGVADLLGAGGLVGSAANLLPLSFSPLSYFNDNTPSQGGGVGMGEVDERTAKSFDFVPVSAASTQHSYGDRSRRGEGGGEAGSASASAGGYVDPTERAVRAARAARDFLGWKSEKHPEDEAGGGGRGGGMGGFSLSRGIGWLIGDGERR